jgi:RNA polymerase primary sigma factor
MRQLKIGKTITNRESHSLEKYLQEIGKVQLLSPEEEATLAKRARNGNDEALNKLVGANLRFVVSVAKQYQNQGLPLSDLINEGNLGLIKAALKFDETKGFKFISYAVWWIRQTILQALAEQGRIVRLPLNKLGFANKISKAWHELEQAFEREPTEQELAEELKVKTEEVYTITCAFQRHVSMDSPVGDGEDLTLADIMENPGTSSADEYLDYHESLKYEVKQSLFALTERQKDVVCCFFGLGGEEQALSLDDIGLKYNLTRERVRQIKDKAINKLKTNSRTKMLRVYLG